MENTETKFVGPMLTEHQIQESSKRRVWILVPAIIAMVLISLSYLPLAWLAPGQSPEFAGLLFVGIIILAFIPVLVADRVAKRHDLFCLKCSQNLMGQFRELRFTRCCPQCGKHIVEGRTRSIYAYKRYAAWSSNRSERLGVRYGVWLFPVLSAWIFLAEITGIGNSNGTQTGFWPFPAFGLGLSLCLWIQKRDRYYALPSVVSLILLIVIALQNCGAFH